jgi:hypothetical protein
MNVSATMKRRLRPAGVNVKLVVILVILAVVAGTVWIIRAARDEYDEAVAEHLERDFVLWCPECQKEFTMSGVEARELLTQVGGDGEKLVECPQCKKFVASWGGQARPEAQPQGDGGVMLP